MRPGEQVGDERQVGGGRGVVRLAAVGWLEGVSAPLRGDPGRGEAERGEAERTEAAVGRATRGDGGLALGFGIVLTPCAVVELSEDPQGGLTRVALPFLYTNEGQDAVEPMLRALGVVVWHLARVVFPEKLEWCELTTIAHKTEIKEDHGALWFNKACESSRLATCILDPTRARGNKKQWYVYLGGGAIDVDQSDLLAGGVVLCKDWQWAALTLLAAWLLLCTCPCGTPELCDPRLIFTAHDDVGVNEAENPLLDD